MKVDPKEDQLIVQKKICSVILTCFGSIIIISGLTQFLVSLFTQAKLEIFVFIFMISISLVQIYSASLLWNRWRSPFGIFLTIVGLAFLVGSSVEINSYLDFRTPVLIIGSLSFLMGIAMLFVQHDLDKKEKLKINESELPLAAK